MIHQIIILSLGVRRCRKVHAVTPARLLHLIIRARQPDHARVKVPDVGRYLREGIACRVARYEDRLNDGLAEKFVCVQMSVWTD